MSRQYVAEERSLVLQYAQIVGIVLLLVGVAGLLLGENPLFGAVNIDIAEDIVHLLTGGLLTWVGFSRDAGRARMIVLVLGVVYLLVGLIGFVMPNLFGLMPHGYGVVDNIIHLVVGALSIVVARR
jgi:hypothetical protein